MIKNSLEWNKISTHMKRQAKNLRNSRDIFKMIDNIGIEVTMLSNAEIDARRGKKHRAEELLIKINQDIEMIEEYILVAALIG